MQKKEVATLKYKDLKLSANSLIITIVSIVLFFIFMVIAAIFVYNYKMKELQLKYPNTEIKK